MQHKLTSDQLSEMQKLNQQVLAATLAAGTRLLEVRLAQDQLDDLNNQLNSAVRELKELIHKQDTIIDSLIQKYGDGEVDLTNGLFISK